MEDSTVEKTGTLRISVKAYAVKWGSTCSHSMQGVYPMRERSALGSRKEAGFRLKWVVQVSSSSCFDSILYMPGKGGWGNEFCCIADTLWCKDLSYMMGIADPNRVHSQVNSPSRKGCNLNRWIFENADTLSVLGREKKRKELTLTSSAFRCGALVAGSGLYEWPRPADDHLSFCRYSRIHQPRWGSRIYLYL